MSSQFEAECVSRLSEILAAEQAALRELLIAAFEEQLDRILAERFAALARQVGAELEAGLARAAAPPPEPWAGLPPEEQHRHLAAQRFARVQVAHLVLDRAEAVGRGRCQRNLYGELETEIEAARQRFRQEHLAACPSMKDYLHLELVRFLAQGDPACMGPDYPGPLV